MMNKVIVGITGGIGSGKTTICNVLEAMGYPVFYSDLQGRQLLASDEILKSSIRDYFGEVVFDGNEINRGRLGEIVFNNKEKLNYLNSLIHPRVKSAFTNWVNEQKSELVFKESAILFESNDSSYHKACSVVTDLEERIRRVTLRDEVKRADVLSRINNQMSDDERIEKSDFIVYNNTTQLIIPQILKLISSVESLNK